jgi:hypothetical protein
VRISHKLALESKQLASLKKQFKECGDRAAAALGRAPHAVPLPPQLCKRSHPCVRGSCGFVADSAATTPSHYMHLVPTLPRRLLKVSYHHKKTSNMLSLSFHGNGCEALALAACPDSLVVRLLHAEVVYDNPFSTDKDLETLSIGATGAPLPPAAADLKLARAIATFDDEARRYPSPDFRPRASPMTPNSVHDSPQLSTHLVLFPLSLETIRGIPTTYLEDVDA